MFRTTNIQMWLLRTVTAAMGTIGSVTAFTHLSMAEAFALIFLLPAYVTILSVVFLKEQVGWRRWSAVLIGSVGVLIVLRPGFRELSIGHLGALAAGMGGAMSIIIFRVMGKQEKRISLYTSGLIGPIIICGALMAPSFEAPNTEQWIYLAGYGLLAALANILLMLAAQRAPASAIASSAIQSDDLGDPVRIFRLPRPYRHANDDRHRSHHYFRSLYFHSRKTTRRGGPSGCGYIGAHPGAC